MDGPGDYYTKLNKPVRGRQAPHDLTYMWNLMEKKTPKLMNKTETGMDTWNRLTAITEEGAGGLGERR